MTQEKLSEVSGIPIPTIRSYENGTRTPRPARGVILALALKADPLWLREGIHWREVAP